MKYILVSGGVISGIGKGLTASSIGVLLKVSPALSCGGARARPTCPAPGARRPAPAPR